MEEQQQLENAVDRILTPILDQLAALQRQVAGMTSERLPKTSDVKEKDLPDAHELELKRSANRDQLVQVLQIHRGSNGESARLLQRQRRTH